MRAVAIFDGETEAERNKLLYGRTIIFGDGTNLRSDLSPPQKLGSRPSARIRSPGCPMGNQGALRETYEQIIAKRRLVC